ncbi:MAG: tripartite tricarboxylate transporter TctB family protein [Pseudolabrys sp.]|nr:tripartite tricarboxylate transporter TctB family protein [Pseudolabrys sp.]
MAEDTKDSPGGGGVFPLRIRGPRDFFGGLALIALALFALWAGSDLSGVSGFSFGPGTVPRLFASLLIVVGAIIAIGGLLNDGPPLESYALRGPLYVVGAIVTFALLIRGAHLGAGIRIPEFGLVIATFLAFMIAVMGGHKIRWVESLIAAAAMTAFCVVLFRYLLQLPFPLWPNF